MNITRVRQQERMSKIGIIKASILKSVDPDLEKLIMFCCSNWGISERTAKEYIKIAKFQIEDDRENNKADTTNAEANTE